MKFEIVKVNENDKNTIYNLMQLYTYELTFFEDETTNFTLLDTGLYEMNKYLDLFWIENSRNPYMIKCDGKLGGFVLTRYREDGYFEISEFFVLNKYRKNGAGRYMATTVFASFKGKWEVDTLLKNKSAQEFWRKVIKEYTKDNYTEQLNDTKTRYVFRFEN